VTLAAVPDEEPRPNGLCALTHGDPDLAGKRRGYRLPIRRLRLVPPPAPPPDRLPEPPAALGRVLRLVLEALDGRRPVEQLRPVLPGDALADLGIRLHEIGHGGRHTLRRVFTCQPSATAVEASAVIDYRPPVGPPRVTAAAARFEHDGVRWVCTVLRLL
jgi:Family of unknown function (DUF6459)